MVCLLGSVSFSLQLQSQIQDFPKEGARFRVKCHVDAIQWGGGGSSRNFPWSQKAYVVQWGGGVVAELCRDLKKKYAIRWGGGSSAEFLFSVTSKRNFTLMGPF